MVENKVRVLIVDDEKIVRDFFKRLLAFLGVDAFDADSGACAVEMVGKEKFDLIFIDVRMPGLNGLDTYRQIRKIDPKVTVVMMTGYAVEEVLLEAKKEGAACHIHKPFDISEIKDIITKNSAERTGTPLKILVIDDEEVVLDFFSKFLGSKNLQFKSTTDSHEALELVKKEKFDLIFLDLVLKDSNGTKIYQDIKNLYPQANIVLMTGYSQRFAELKGKMDIAGCLYKPFEVDSIVKFIEMAKVKANG